MAFNVLLWLEFTDVNLKPLNKDAIIRGKYKVKKDINIQSNDINPNKKVMRNNISIYVTCTQMSLQQQYILLEINAKIIKTNVRNSRNMNIFNACINKSNPVAVVNVPP